MGNKEDAGEKQTVMVWVFWIITMLVFILGGVFIGIGFLEPWEPDIVVVGEIKDKQFENENFYFVMDASGKISLYEVSPDVYYQYDVGDITKVTIHDTDDYSPIFFLVGMFMVFGGGLVLVFKISW